MYRTILRVGGLTVLLVLTAGAIRAADVTPTDEGKAVDFKGKSFDLKAKGEAAILLSCPAGKEVTVTTKGDKETDVHLFVYDGDKKEVGKDVSPARSARSSSPRRKRASSSSWSAISVRAPTM